MSKIWRLIKYFLFFLFTFGIINSFFRVKSNVFAIILSVIYTSIITIGIYKFRSNIVIDNKSPPSLTQKITSFTKSFIKFIFLAFVFTTFSIGFFIAYDAERNRVEAFKYAVLLQEYCVANKECAKINPEIKSWGLNVEKEKFSFFVPEWLNGTSIEGGVNKKLTAVIHKSSSSENCEYSMETKNWSCHTNENGI